jgi:hypothetical protein
MTYQDNPLTKTIKKILLPFTIFLLIMAAASTLSLQHLLSYDQYNAILLIALGASGMIAFMSQLKADTFLNRHKISCSACFIWIMTFLVLLITYLHLAWEMSLFLTIAVCIAPLTVVFAVESHASIERELSSSV